MKYFLDSAKMDEIDYAFEMYGIDGVTTNPRHIMASGKSMDYFVREISRWVRDKGVEGVERFPISIEIDPFLSEYADMVEAGKAMQARCPNFVIKIPCIEQGYIAARKLQSMGVNINLTLAFSPSQAIPAGKMGAYFVSPFVGWKESSGEDTFQYIKDICDIYRHYGFQTQVIVAALRSGKQIVDAAKAGAHCVTCGLAVYKDSFEHPFTRHGLGIFQNAFRNIAQD